MVDYTTPSSIPAFAGRLSPDEIHDFQQIVHRTTHTLLDDVTAAARANQLLYLVIALVGDPTGQLVRTSSSLDEIRGQF